MDQTQEQQYWALVESFIEKANASCEENELGLVNGALMQAAARFNAFYLAASSESRKDLKEDKESSVKDFGGEYKKLLAENLDDYIENYKVYMRDATEPS
ncbi:hypothetical protein TDB9533_02849 [Thalassocella blandensis]|nr:hypothetical protein TDB9533_02849 [Thalassocella blandensis]